MGGMRAQTTREEVVNAVTHGIGVALSIPALVVMVVWASVHGDAWSVVGVSVFGATLVALYLTSTLYHALVATRARGLFRVLDHSAIFLLIAGTYTPVALVTLRGPWGWTLFGLIWAMATAGIVAKAVLLDRMRVVSSVLYVAMGWLVLIAVRPLVRDAPPGLLAWLVAGGLCYTAGVAFYTRRSLRYHHAIWHLFVLAGSACHVAGVLLHVTTA